MFSDEQFAGFNRNSIMSDDLIIPYDYYTMNKKDNDSFYNTFIEEFSYKNKNRNILLHEESHNEEVDNLNDSYTSYKTKNDENENIIDLLETNTSFTGNNTINYLDNNYSNNQNKPVFKTVQNFRNLNHKSKISYKIVTKNQKKTILTDLQTLTTKEVANKYHVSVRNITRWKKSGIDRKKGSGRKFKDPDLEREIMEWYYKQDPKYITSKIFREKAMQLSKDKSFKASTGWLVRLKLKFGIIFARY
jgi:hypothetical protein